MNHEIWNLFNTKWNLIILKSLDLKAPIRFNELKQSIQGLSANVLSERLAQLEKQGLVKRSVSNKGTLHISYILSERCERLKKILLELDEWISQWTNLAIVDDESKNSVLTKQLLELLRNQIKKTEYNFIRDKLSFLLGDKSSDLITNFEPLKNIIIDLYGDELGDNILKKLNDHIRSYQVNL